MVVSIRTRPESRVMPATRRRCSGCSRVSIRTRPESRVMLPRHCLAQPRASCFNPHPARKPGDAGDPKALLGLFEGFNPHPARKPGDASPALPCSTTGILFQSAPGPKAG